MNSFFRKIIVITLAILLIFPLQAVFGISFLNRVEAQETSGNVSLPGWERGDTGSGTPSATVTIPESMWGDSTPGQQAGTATGLRATPIEGAFGESSTASPLSGETASELISCSVASLMATLFSNILSVLGGALSQFVPDLEVPVKDTTQRSKETGTTIFGIPILPSWDAVAYCLGNLIVAYIAQTAVEWINSGFGGNPAFVTDPSQFFQALADIETENFLYELSGSSVCSPYTQGIQQRIATNAMSGFNDRAACTFQDGELESFFSGENTSLSTLARFGNPVNHYWGAQREAEIELQNRIAVQQDEQRFLLDIGRGFFSQRGEDGLINVIGSLIADQASHRLNIPLDRAATAQGINQVITTLLNAVFKASIGELLSGPEVSSQGYSLDPPAKNSQGATVAQPLR